MPNGKRVRKRTNVHVRARFSLSLICDSGGDRPRQWFPNGFPSLYILRLVGEEKLLLEILLRVLYTPLQKDKV